MLYQYYIHLTPIFFLSTFLILITTTAYKMVHLLLQQAVGDPIVRYNVGHYTSN